MNKFTWDIKHDNLSAYTTPALFSITANEATGKHIGPFSFTQASTPANDILSSGFESMSFRYRFQAQAGSGGDTVFADTSLYDQYINGLFDNGTARVYRVASNQFGLVRKSKILRYRASGWQYEFLPSDTLLSPSSTQASFRFPGWYGSPAGIWVKIVAVATSSDNSKAFESSPVTAFFTWTNLNDGSAPLYSTTSGGALPVSMQPQQHAGDVNGFTSSSVAPPTGFTAVQNPSSGLIQLKWNYPTSAVAAIRGFRLYRSSWSSQQQEGFSIALQHDGAPQVLPGDLVFVDTTLRSWSRKQYSSERIHGTPEASNPVLAPQFFNDETGGLQSWSYVTHPAPVPARLRIEGGQTCQMVTSKSVASTVRIAEYFYGSTTQSYYFVFQGGATYTVDGWFRAAAGQRLNVSFYLNQFYNNPNQYPCVAAMKSHFPINFEVRDSWKRYSFNLTIPRGCVYSSDGPIGQAVWEWSSPSTLYMDNLRIFEAIAQFGDWLPVDYNAMAMSGMKFLRTHMFVKTGFGYTMDGFTNLVGGNNQFGTRGNSWTLPSLLRLVRNAKLDPWLQIEMCMSEVEWLAFAEFMCATYDPAVDTPASKPWAYKRYSQGNVRPWIDFFEKILLELSNETWNGMFAPWIFLGVDMTDAATSAVVGSGTLYGMFQEHVIGILKSSPYWSTSADSKFTFVIGGFAVQRGQDGYGQTAARSSPSSKLVTIAGYNGGWERGQLATNSKDGFLGILVEDVITLNAEGEDLTLTQIAMEQSKAASYELGTYEAGPGYNLNGLNGVSITDAQVEAESLAMKSQAGGVATLDTFLYRARLGWTEQNFFTFSRNRYYWVSHSPTYLGGWAYPPWSALTMFNQFATGKFLLVNPVSVPIMNFQGSKNIPLLAVYATVPDSSTYCVFVISRKLNNYPYLSNNGNTPLSLALPFYSAKSADVVYLSVPGGPTTSTLDNNSVPLMKRSLNVSQLSFSPTFNVNVPPGSAYLYIFKNVKMWDKPSLAQSLFIAPIRKVVKYPNVNVQFRVAFESPWNSFSKQNVIVSGSAGCSSAGLSISFDPWSRNTSAILTVTDMRSPGNVTVTIKSIQSTATFAVDSSNPPIPIAPWAVIATNLSFATLHWSIVADISSYPSNAIVNWGSLPTNTPYSSGLKPIVDSCARCTLCVASQSTFCSTASLKVKLNNAVNSGTVYQDKRPIYFVIQSSNSKGLSGNAFLSVYAFSDKFDNPNYLMGSRPSGWYCSPTSDCSFALLEPYNALKPVTSPTRTPYMHFIQWGTATIAYQYDGTSFLIPELQFLKFYTTRMTFSVARTNGYSMIGTLLHLSDYSNFVQAVIIPSDGVFRLFGQWNGQSYYGNVVDITPDIGETSSKTAIDLGEFWSLDVATQPAGDQYCSSMLQVRVSIRDQSGACRIDFGASYFSDPNSSVQRAGACVVSLLTYCAFGGSAGTFAMYSSVANGGDGGNDFAGHYIGSFGVDSIPLI